MKFKIQKLIIGVLFNFILIGSDNLKIPEPYNLDQNEDDFVLIGGSTGNMSPSIKKSFFVGSDVDNNFDEMDFDTIVSGFIESARARLAIENSMEKKSMIIAKTTSDIYQLAEDAEINANVMIEDLKGAFAQEYPEVIAWQYLDERIKNKTRQADKPEWTQAQLQELSKAQDVYAFLLQLSKTELSAIELQKEMKRVLAEYPYFNSWIQESLRNNAFQLFNKNKNEVIEAFRLVCQEKQSDEKFNHHGSDEKMELPIVVNLNQNQRAYYTNMGLLGLTPEKNTNIKIDDSFELEEVLNQFSEDRELHATLAPYFVSQKSIINLIENPLLKAEAIMQLSISVQALGEDKTQINTIKKMFNAYFNREISESLNYLQRNKVNLNVIKMMLPDQWSYDARKKMHNSFYSIYRQIQEHSKK